MNDEECPRFFPVKDLWLGVWKPKGCLPQQHFLYIQDWAFTVVVNFPQREQPKQPQFSSPEPSPKNRLPTKGLPLDPNELRRALQKETKPKKEEKNSLKKSLKRFFLSEINKRNPYAELDCETGEPQFHGVHTFEVVFNDISGFNHTNNDMLHRVIVEGIKYKKRVFKDVAEFFDFYSELKPQNRAAHALPG